MQKIVLALDIGSTKLKAALIDAGGRTLASIQEPSPLAAADVAPESVLRAAAVSASRVCGDVRPDAIAITGATRTSVLVAEDGRALGHAIKLDDGRGAAFQQELQQAYRAENAAGFGAFHPLARALDVRQTEPERYRQTRWLLELKDWLNLRLTGQACCDNVAWGRIAPAGQTMDGLLHGLGLKPDLFARPLAPASLLGPLRMDSDSGWERWQGVPVVVCGFDAWCASFGMGCVREGAVYNVCGTTEVFGSFGTRLREIAGVPCLPWGNGLYHLGGPCSTGLATLAWFGARFLGDSDPSAVLACAAEAGPDCPLGVPFVNGERMPFWRPDLRAGFIGVQSHHGRPEFARALVDGLLVFQRCLLRLLAETPAAVHLSGGGALLPGWAELKASAFARPVYLPDCEEPGLLGAAMCAQVALGAFASLSEAQQVLAPAGRQVMPNPDAAQRLGAREAQLLPHFPEMPRP